MANYTIYPQDHSKLDTFTKGILTTYPARTDYTIDSIYRQFETYLGLEPWMIYILLQDHLLLEIPTISKIYILSQDHTITDGYTKPLWFSRFAMTIRGPLNRGAWKKGGKTVIWQYNAEKKDFVSYIRDYSTCVLTPVFREYTNKLKLAMQDWNNLPEEEKEYWRNKAKNKPVYGNNLYFKEWLKTH